MDIKRVVFYFFSGTGNTETAVEAMAAVFLKNGIKCEIFQIPDAAFEDREDTLFIFASPVYELALPEFVYKWLANIPGNTQRNSSAALLTTQAGLSLFVKTPVGRLLRNKGFNLISYRSLVFPSNFIITESETRNRKKIRSGICNAERFAEDLMRDDAPPWRCGNLPVAVLFPLHRIGAKIFSWIFSHYKTNEKCTKCGKCERNCPVKNVKVTDSGVVWGRECQVCLRCINNCPENAVRSTVCNLFYKAYYKKPEMLEVNQKSSSGKD